MSLALSRASTLKAELRLAQAISEFQKDLSAEQKVVFCSSRDKSTRNPPNYQDVMRLTEEIDRNASELLKSRRCFGTRFTNVLHAIQQIAALGDVIVGGSQNILACGVWSLLRMTLLTVVNFSSYLQKLSGLFMEVGRSAPRYERLHQLYPRSKALQSQLSEYFIVIVRVCHQLLKMTKKSAFGQLVSFPSDADMKVHESDLKNIATQIKDEVTLLMGQEAREQNSRLSTILRSTEADAHRQRQDTHIRVLSTCSTYDYETTWKETRKQGETIWFRQSTTYQEWKASTESATLVCTGKLGSGKSVMLANIVGDLSLDKETHDCPVAYFFCRHDIADSLLCSTVIRSLGRQILRSIPDLSSVDQRFKRNVPFVDSDMVLSTLLDLPRTFQVNFVLDGMDECNDQERRVLVAQLRKLQNAFNLRICAACRSDIDNLPTTLLDSLAESALLALPEENPEIKRFIDAELYDRVESGKLVLGDPQLSLEIADALLAGAQGMFLWVALQIEALCAETTDAGIRSALAELPRTLNETFSRILKRANIHETGRSYQTQTFELVIAAHRPLTTDELREALSVIPGDDTWDPAQQLNNVYGALASCGSLIMVDEENLTVRLIHHSVKQFLFTTPCPTQDQSYFADANQRMCATVLTYLNYGVFDTQLSTTVVPAIPMQGTPYKIIRSMHNASTSRTLALKLLRARRHSSVDIGKVVSEAIKRHDGPVHETFKFYAYAKKYWLKHVCHMTEDRSSAYKMLLKLVSSSDSRVLSPSSMTGDELTQLLFWAAQHGHPEVLKLCLDNSADIKTLDTLQSSTLLFEAAANGRNKIIEVLAEHGANLEYKDRDGRTALSFAAGLGLDTTVEALIAGGGNLEAGDNEKWTPLCWAACNGHEAVVRTLLAKGANEFGLDCRDDDQEIRPLHIPSRYGDPLWIAVDKSQPTIVKILMTNGAVPRSEMHAPLLSRAIGKGHIPILEMLLEQGIKPDTGTEGLLLRQSILGARKQIVKLLLSHGANPNQSDDIGGRTPLVTATVMTLTNLKKGLSMLKLLLAHGADANIAAIDGKTALWYAALHCQADCVKILVENGADRSVMANDGSTCWFKRDNLRSLERIQILLDNGFDVNLKDGSGRTPLANAAIYGDENMARILLAHGADMDSKDNDGLTPLQTAEDEGVRTLLLEEAAKRDRAAATEGLTAMLVSLRTVFNDETETKSQSDRLMDRLQRPCEG